MSSHRIRFTIRTLMILVGIAALSAWVIEEWRRYRYRLPGPVFPKTYYVGDLIGKPGQETSPLSPGASKRFSRTFDEGPS
jgi:hypothetical protein